MTRLGKILSVFVLFFSLAFMGFAGVSSVGGVNWDGERSLLERDYIFEYSGGEMPTWSVKKRRGEESVGSSTPVLPKVLIAARQDQIGGQKEQLTSLDERIPRVQERIDEASRLVQIDTEAMKVRIDALAEVLKQQNETVDKVAKDGDKMAQEALSIRKEAERRREDVFRLRSELEEVETDRFQIEEQKKRLQDFLTRIGAINERLERRKLQLEAAVGTKNDNVLQGVVR